MKSGRLLRIIAIVLMALVLLVSSLSLLLERRGDSSSGRVAMVFIDGDRLFPQMDYSQLFSDLDIASYYHMGNDHLTKDEMNTCIEQAKSRSGATDVILLAEGSYAYDGLQLASARTDVKNCILLSPILAENADTSFLGLTSPASKVAIFSTVSTTSGNLYELMSGEDTKFTPGIQGDEQGMALYISPDATRYYANYTGQQLFKSETLAASITLNHPVVQTYLSNYLKNYCLEEAGISRGPLGYWSIKVICTTVLVMAFFLYAATLPAEVKNQSIKEASERPTPEKAPAPAGSDGARPKAKLLSRSVFEKYHAAQNHLLALLLLVAAIFSLVAVLCTIKKPDATKPVLLVWVWAAYMISAFYLLPFTRKFPRRQVRKNRAQWMLHVIFTILLIADVFMLLLLWRGAGFLKISLLLLAALFLAVMLGVSVTMLQITDSLLSEGDPKRNVLDSVKFSAIRFVPMVIVFSFSFIMKKDISMISVVLLSLQLLLAGYLRRVVRRGALGDLLSVVLFACMYWMVF